MVRGNARVDDRARLVHKIAPAALYRPKPENRVGVEQVFDQIPPPPVDRMDINRCQIAVRVPV